MKGEPWNRLAVWRWVGKWRWNLLCSDGTLLTKGPGRYGHIRLAGHLKSPLRSSLVIVHQMGLSRDPAAYSLAIFSA